MSYSAEGGNFEGRSRARGGFGNQIGQTERRGRNGEAERANRDAMNRAAARSAPAGPFKTPKYEASWQNLAKLGRMVGPMIANPGIGLAAPVAQSILSGDPYAPFDRPSGWSSYSQRDIDATGSDPRGNIGARDTAIGAALAQARHGALLEEARHRQAYRPKREPHPAIPLDQYAPPPVIFDRAPGLPYYGVAGPSHTVPLSTRRKASGYGGVARPFPIPSPSSNVQRS